MDNTTSKKKQLHLKKKEASEDENPDFLKFPRTRHLFDAGGGVSRDDLLMDVSERNVFLQHPSISIEEKVDGANLGISVTEDYKIIFQNRSHWVTSATSQQWKTLDIWLKQHTGLFNFLTPDHILFGEWLYAKHSIHYTKLPDTFLAFDIFQKSSGKFLSLAERNRLLEGSGIHTVPVLAQGRFSVEDIKKMLDNQSQFYDGPVEGVYLRIDDDNNTYLRERAKVVRHDFLQTNVDGEVEHWTKAGRRDSSRSDRG